MTELREKYAELTRLRLARRAAPSEAPPLGALRALARRFPGALRELERLPLELLIGRRDELERVARGLHAEPLWAIAQSHFHAELRVALAAKRAAPKKAASSVPASPSVRAGERPPEPRLVAKAIVRVASSLAIDEAHCRRLVFPWELSDDA